MCVHDTDARGLCTKNGAHCAFAHGAPDLRPPVLDMRELQALENPDGTDGDAAAPNALDRERNLMNEDPKWQGRLFNYLISKIKFYKHLSNFIFNLLVFKNLLYCE